MSLDDETTTQTTDDGLHYIAEEVEFEETGRVIADVEGREIAIFDVDGEFYALANYCVHQGGPLCEGTVSGTLAVDDDFELEYSREDEIVSCPWHGWEFDIKTGEHLAHTGHRTPMYDVVRRDGNVYLDL